MKDAKKHRLFPSVRLLVLILAVFSGGIEYLTRINLNLTIVSMAKHQPNEQQNNLTNEGCRNLYHTSIKKQTVEHATNET